MNQMYSQKSSSLSRRILKESTVSYRYQFFLLIGLLILKDCASNNVLKTDNNQQQQIRLHEENVNERQLYEKNKLPNTLFTKPTPVINPIVPLQNSNVEVKATKHVSILNYIIHNNDNGGLTKQIEKSNNINNVVSILTTLPPATQPPSNIPTSDSNYYYYLAGTQGTDNNNTNTIVDKRKTNKKQTIRDIIYDLYNNTMNDTNIVIMSPNITNNTSNNGTINPSFSSNKYSKGTLYPTIKIYKKKTKNYKKKQYYAIEMNNNNDNIITYSKKGGKGKSNKKSLIPSISYSPSISLIPTTIPTIIQSDTPTTMFYVPKMKKNNDYNEGKGNKKKSKKYDYYSYYPSDFSSSSPKSSKNIDQPSISPTISSVPSSSISPSSLSYKGKGKGSMISIKSKNTYVPYSMKQMKNKKKFKIPKLSEKDNIINIPIIPTTSPPNIINGNTIKPTLSPLLGFIPTFTAPNNILAPNNNILPIIPTPQLPSPFLTNSPTEISGLIPNNNTIAPTNAAVPINLRVGHKIFYNITTTRLPLNVEISIVNDITQEYLNSYFTELYTDMILFDTEFNNSEYFLNELFEIQFNSIAIFPPDTITIPEEDEIEQKLLNAFKYPLDLSYLDLLMSLPDSNVFSTTNYVESEIVLDDIRSIDTNLNTITSRTKRAVGLTAGAMVFVALLLGIGFIQKNKSNNNDVSDTKPTNKNSGYATVDGDTCEGTATVWSGTYSRYQNKNRRKSKKNKDKNKLVDENPYLEEGMSLDGISEWNTMKNDSNLQNTRINDYDECTLDNDSVIEFVERESDCLLRSSDEEQYQQANEKQIDDEMKPLSKGLDDPQDYSAWNASNDNYDHGKLYDKTESNLNTNKRSDDAISVAYSEDENVPLRVVDLIKRFTPPR